MSHLAHAYLFVVCVFFLAICPYVSMEIAAHGINYQKLNNVSTDLFLIMIIVMHIC